MRIALTALLALHGVLHVLGVIQWWHLAAVPQLTGRTLVPVPVAAHWAFALSWLIALVLLLGAAAMRIVQGHGWWAPALAGVFVSQALVIVAWPDAKAGTIANVAIAIAAVLAAAHATFDRQVAAEARALLAVRTSDKNDVVQKHELDGLPDPVRRWLEASGVVGRERAHTVRLQQLGSLRTAPGRAWMPAQAEQYFAVDQPGFIWKVEATMMKVLPIVGRDRYFGGRGDMLIKAASLVNVVNQSDDKIAEGAMLRFLGEMIWFPSAALNAYLRWEPIDAQRARVTMTDAGRSVTAELSFDELGRATGLRAMRYFGGGAAAKLTPWFARCSAWADVRGVQVPVRGEVLWDRPDGEFSYYRWEILDVEMNRPDLYGARQRPTESTRAEWQEPALSRSSP